jgi:hypothetical protein
MDATSTESENNKIKIASGRFYEIKDKAQSRQGKQSGTRDQHGTYGKQDYTQNSQKFKDKENFQLRLSTENALESSGKMEQENNFF